MADSAALIDCLLDRTVGLGVVLIDEAGRITWTNRGATRLFGADEGGLVGLAYDDLFVEEDRALGAAANEIAIAIARGYSEDDRWHRRVDGSRFWANGILTALRDEANVLQGFGKILRNRTDVKEQVVALRKRVELLEARDASRIEMLAGTAHEMRNSLTGVSAIVDALHRGTLGQERAARLGMIAGRQLEVMQRLSDELLDAAGVKMARATETTRVALEGEIDAAANAVRDALGERRLWVLTPPGSVECEIDRTRFQQVLGNLLRNAIKFTRDDGKIWVKLTVEGRDAVVRVEDDGRGIDAAMLQTIFDAFTQADPNSPRGEGIGMGLSIARDLTRLMRGSIQAISDGPGRGASFIVRLPVADEDRPA